MTLPVALRCLLLIALVAAGCERRPTSRPNVILITVDALRADHVGSYGYRLPTSPTMDRLAAEGVRFEDVTVQWPKTWPSVASLLTGTYPATNGIRFSPRPVSRSARDGAHAGVAKASLKRMPSRESASMPGVAKALPPYAPDTRGRGHRLRAKECSVARCSGVASRTPEGDGGSDCRTEAEQRATRHHFRCRDAVEAFGADRSQVAEGFEPLDLGGI